MRQVRPEGRGGFLRFTRVSLIGYLTMLLWVGFASGVMYLSWGDAGGWLGICVGALGIAFPFASPFRRLWSNGNASAAYHRLVFLGSVVLVLMFGMMAVVFIRDQSYIYNEHDGLSLVLWGGAAILSSAGLLASMIAFALDRRDSARLGD